MPTMTQETTVVVRWEAVNNTIRTVGEGLKVAEAMLEHQSEAVQTRQQAYANARLIAAAPLLLEAITAMKHDIDILYAHHREPNNPYLLNLNNAIAAAEGSQP